MCVYKMNVEERLKALEEALEKETTLRRNDTDRLMKNLARREKAIVSQIKSEGERMDGNFDKSDKEIAKLTERIAALEAQNAPKRRRGLFGVHSSSFQNKTVW